MVIVLLVVALTLAVSAQEGEISPTEGDTAKGEETLTEGEESATGQDYAGENLFSEVMNWASEHFSGIILSLGAIWAVLPKIGGVAKLKGLLTTVVAALLAMKSYMDDEKNPKSVYNVLKRQGDAISKFMNTMAPYLERLDREGDTVKEIGEALAAFNGELRKIRAVLIAEEESHELEAKVFNDLISISTTVSEKQKAEMERQWMEGASKVKKAVEEAISSDGQNQKESA